MSELGTGIVPSIEKDTYSNNNGETTTPALDNAKNAVINSEVRSISSITSFFAHG